MALDTTEIFVAGNGHIYVADEGTTLPTDLSDLSSDPNYVELGYTTEDGVTFTVTRETQSLNAWQSNEPVRTLETSRTSTVAFTVMQPNPDNIAIALGGGDIDKGATEGTYTFPDPGESVRHVLVVDAFDGDTQYRFVYDRVEQQGDVTMQLQRGDSANLPMEFGVLAGAEKPTIISDAAAFLSGS